MQPEIKKVALASTRATSNISTMLSKFSLANLPKQQVELKLTSVIDMKCDVEDIIGQCIKENSFDNPIFISNEKNGRSNRGVDNSITTYNYDYDGNLILPRGYMRNLLEILKEYAIDPQIVDNRISNICVYPEKLHEIELRPYQQRAVDEAMKFNQGCIISPTGSGKSLIGLEIIRRHQQRALIICHRGELAKQWISVINERLGIEAGFIGDGQWKISNITLAMIQTLAAHENKTINLSNDFGLVLLDEMHHTPASTFFDVMGLLSSKFRYGLSATPKRRDGLEQMIYRAIGPTIATISKKEVEGIGATVPVTVNLIQTAFDPGLVDSWNEYINSLTTSTDRNLKIIDLAEASNNPTLILVDRVAHAEQISKMLNRRKIDHVLAHGGIGKKNHENAMSNMRSSKLTVGTTSLLGEGIDISSWSVLIMAAPISSEIKLMQAIGRIVRPAHGKEKAIVYDLKDNCAFSGASFNKRFEIYKKNRIWVNFEK